MSPSRAVLELFCEMNISPRRIELLEVLSVEVEYPSREKNMTHDSVSIFFKLLLKILL